MSDRFDSFRQMIDVDRLAHAHVVVLGAGRVGFAVMTPLVMMGVGRITAIDHDLVDTRNPGYTEHDVNRSKVEAAGARLKALNPALHYDGLPVKLGPRSLSRLLPLMRSADCVGLFIDAFRVVHHVVRQVHAYVPCVAAVQAAGQGFADIGFSVPGRTPCLDCSMGLLNYVQAAGGQALPVHVNLLADVVACYVLGLILAGSGGFELFGHFLNLRRCRAFLRAGPGDFLLPMPEKVPCFLKLVDVVTAGWRPGCPVCWGYETQPE